MSAVRRWLRRLRCLITGHDRRTGPSGGALSLWRWCPRCGWRRRIHP